MGRFFLPRQWRIPKVVLALILLEFPFTVANLSLFGIAAPNTYRTTLWKYGGEQGWNSDPSDVAYAAYNHRTMEIPVVWSSLNTNYNMYIGVVCMFFYLIKFTLWLLHIFYPILSLLLHLVLAALWSVSIYLQTAPDTVDPNHENHGAPWYITKNCNVVADKTVRGYCMQAKSAFAVSVVMLTIYATFLILTIHSLIPTPEARTRHATKLAEKQAEKELYASSSYPYADDMMTPEEQWQHMWELQQLPRTPGTATGGAPWRAGGWPATPRTRAFEELQGGGGHGGQEYYGGGGMGGGQTVYYAPPVEQKGAQGEVQYAGVAPQGEVDEHGHGYDGKGKGTAM